MEDLQAFQYELFIGNDNNFYLLYKINYVDKNSVKKDLSQLLSQGKLIEARIEKINFKQAVGEGMLTDLTLSFENLAGTNISPEMELVDSQPQLNRYEAGKTLSLRLNTSSDPLVPWLPAEVKEATENRQRRRWLLPFSFLYMVGTFMLYQYLNGHSAFRGLAIYEATNDSLFPWLMPVHSWLLAPFLGIIVMGTINKFENLHAGLDPKSSRVLLHGLAAQGEIISLKETGTSYNDQPEMLMRIKFTDQKGLDHYHEVKQVIAQHELNHYQPGPKNILYLPEDPSQFQIMP